MKTEKEIREEIERIEQLYTPENIPEYMRGVYDTLKWILNEKKEEV